MTDLVAAFHLAKESGTMRACFSEHKGSDRDPLLILGEMRSLLVLNVASLSHPISKIG